MPDEYISREAAIEEIDKWLDSVGTALVGKGLSYYGELIGCIEDARAADVAEVVRCKDCKQYNTTGCSKGFGWCENIDRGTSDNFYCANGKQLNKESEDD